MEGPSLVIAAEEIGPFVGEKVRQVGGNTTLEVESLRGQRLEEIRTWGKVLFLRFPERTLRVHFLLWGSYRVNDRRDAPPRLSLTFPSGELNLYSCSLRWLEELPELDSAVDVMSPDWKRSTVLRRLRQASNPMLGDVLLDQTIFSGVGNIIKNEVLYNLHLHPETPLDSLSAEDRRRLVDEAHRYSWQFYEWKKKYELRKHWRIYRQRFCKECGAKTAMTRTGLRQRYSYTCPECQPAQAASGRRRVPRRAAAKSARRRPSK